MSETIRLGSPKAVPSGRKIIFHLSERWNIEVANIGIDSNGKIIYEIGLNSFDKNTDERIALFECHGHIESLESVRDVMQILIDNEKNRHN